MQARWSVPITWLASMRPRHKAAENVGAEHREIRPVALASMRPRHKAAENGWSGRGEPRLLGRLQ